MSDLVERATFIYFIGMMVTVAIAVVGGLMADWYNRKSYTMLGAMAWLWPALLIFIGVSLALDVWRKRAAERRKHGRR